jgi:hypothetical protein
MSDADELALLRLEIERLETELSDCRTSLSVLQLENSALQKQRLADIKRLAGIRTVE